MFLYHFKYIDYDHIGSTHRRTVRLSFSARLPQAFALGLR